MLRGLLGPMEKHHKVRISDAAIVAAVKLSQRYIPARQLPDKAVSLLDTACARVAISQTADAGRDRGRAASRSPRSSRRRQALIARARSRRRPTTSASPRSTRSSRERSEKLATLESGLGRRDGARRGDQRCALREKPSRRGRAVGRGRAPPDGRSARPERDAARQGRRRSSAIDPGQADDLRPCRRAGGRLGRLGLDRHSGRPDGRGTRSRPS